MSRSAALLSWFRSPVNLVAGGLVVLGLALTNLSWGFLALSALGTFGPGILRELGWLRDRDECQLRAARRAGYHAYLAGGLLVFLLVALFRARTGSDGQPIPLANPGALATTILAVMWFTWLISSLLSFWGPQKTARRLLFVFGGVWLLFNILSGAGDWQVSAMQSLLAVPFIALGLSANRWPHVTGVVLLLTAAFFWQFFGLGAIVSEPLRLGRTVVVILFLGPLVASGLSLLSLRRKTIVPDG